MFPWNLSTRHDFNRFQRERVWGCYRYAVTYIKLCTYAYYVLSSILYSMMNNEHTVVVVHSFRRRKMIFRTENRRYPVFNKRIAHYKNTNCFSSQIPWNLRVYAAYANFKLDTSDFPNDFVERQIQPTSAMVPVCFGNVRVRFEESKNRTRRQTVVIVRFRVLYDSGIRSRGRKRDFRCRLAYVIITRASPYRARRATA